MKKQKGFTLIELLVVIAIIGVLSTVVLASVNSARLKGRDAKRKSDLNTIYTAMNLYFQNNGCLPATSATVCSGAAGYSESNIGGWDYSSQSGFMPFLSSVMAQVPVDPVNNGAGDVLNGGTGYSYGYYCYTSNHTVALGAKLESTGAIYWKVVGGTASSKFVCS
ncbi:MAG: hypothetical protein JWN89_701 [Parcubacteria group bacterium]|nr:hypothetical protein [Parcubacteria group bacterium]